MALLDNTSQDATLEAGTGAVAAGTVDAAINQLFEENQEELSGQFPFTSVSPAVPPNDDILLAAASAGLVVLGEEMGSDTLSNVGAGATGYSLGMLAATTAQRNL